MSTNHPASVSSPCSDTTAGTGPAWTRGLKKYGNYYEGIVKSAELALEIHKQDTVTTFGIRRTEKPKSALAPAAPAVGNENINHDAQYHKDSVDKPKVKTESQNAR
jgi:hypothetical protein